MTGQVGSTALTFDGQVAVITGAGRGLGREYARILAARGAFIVVNDVGAGVDGSPTGESPAEELVAELTAAGGTAVADHHDVSEAESAAQIVETALDRFSRIDILVNNAGILRDKAFHNMTPADIDQVLDVHLRGSAYVTLAAWPHLREQGYGRVVMTTSVAGYLGNFGQANYGSAKAGLIGLTRVLAIEGGRRGIAVNAVAPGAGTRMTEAVMGPLAERLTPSLVAPVVAMLAHSSCPLNGEVLITAGGRVARLLVGQTRGWFSPALTPEAVLDHLDEILEPADAPAIADVAQELTMLQGLLAQS